jgi:acetyltransferase-like isoleucine patch superfamily enzyme
MPFLNDTQVLSIGFKSVGSNPLISSFATFYAAHEISIGDNVRIDDFTCLSGNIHIGDHVHIGTHSHLAGGELGITIGDFSGFASGVIIFTRSDDYSGLALSNPTIPKEFRLITEQPILIGRHVKAGVRSIFLPGSRIGDGCAFQMNSVISGETKTFHFYAGDPATEMGVLSKRLLEEEKRFWLS